MDAHQLCDLASKYNLSGEVIPSVNEAIKKAIKSASPDDLIFIGGSTFVVAEIENL
jgi:dihydrofolate synthase/folylpolyglutamate synthase